MKRILMVVFASVSLAAAQEPAKKKAPAKAAPVAKKQAAPKAAPKPGPITIPKDAKEISPGTFRWVDPKGQAWLYNQTPFGIMRGPEPKNPEPEPVPTDWKVTEEGDQLTFERPWPFGSPKRWTKSKNDLTTMERAVWDRSRQTAGKQ